MMLPILFSPANWAYKIGLSVRRWRDSPRTNGPIDFKLCTSNKCRQTQTGIDFGPNRVTVRLAGLLSTVNSTRF
jgi:hypothetical protein